MEIAVIRGKQRAPRPRCSRASVKREMIETSSVPLFLHLSLHLSLHD
jgi:hypothetical protein